MKGPLLPVLFSLLACQPEPPGELVLRAEFGVLFGGQIQERKEIPFILDAGAQTIGFRVEFGAPLARDVTIGWRFERPLIPARIRPGARGSVSRAAAAEATGTASTTGTGVARAGERRFDQTLRLVPGDPLGRWTARVTVQGKTVIDRPVDIYDPATRARSSAADAGP